MKILSISKSNNHWKNRTDLYVHNTHMAWVNNRSSGLAAYIFCVVKKNVRRKVERAIREAVVVVVVVVVVIVVVNILKFSGILLLKDI